MEHKKIELIVPRIVVDEFDRHKTRIVQEATKSMSSILKRAKELATRPSSRTVEPLLAKAKVLIPVGLKSRPRKWILFAGSRTELHTEVINMPLDQENTVDAVGIETATDVVALTIADSWTWEDETAHLLALQKKLNAYFDFVSGGQLVESYPKAKGRKVRIDIIGRYPLPVSALDFLRKAQQVAASRGIDVATKTIS